MADNSEKITLVDEDNKEHDFTVVDLIEVESKRYAVLLPEEDPDAGAVIFRIEEDENGEEFLVDIEDDEEFDKVVQILEEDAIE